MADTAHGVEAAHGAADAAGHSAGAFPPFDASLFAHQLIWFAIAFGVLYWLMSNVALPRVAAVLEKREATVKGDLDVAASAGASAESAREAAEKARAQAHAEARKLIDDMRTKAQAELAVEQAKAEETLAARGAAAAERINSARAKALSEVDGMASDLARDIVAKLGPAGAAA